MRDLISIPLVVAALTCSPNAIGLAQEAKPTPPPAKAAPQSIPAELREFRGMMLGRLVDRDIERGTFNVSIDYISRVWENNQSRDPRVAVGKTFKVDGVTGKWLDQLLLVKPGETIEFEAQHRGGDTLTFPGEWLRKVPAFSPSEHPVPPNGFRGFAGVVTGKIERKNPESHEVILRIDGVEKSFDRSQAKAADEVIGKPIVLAGFWGKLAEPLDRLEPGDRVRAGVLHRVPKSDHFTVAEFIEEVSGSPTSTPTANKTPDAPRSSGDFPAGMEGFRGILRGVLVSSDVEKGELVFKADRVTRTWEQNRAKDTESCRGKTFVVKRLSGKWLDVLISLKPGDAIEVEAFHNGGNHLDFVSEWLKKVE